MIVWHSWVHYVLYLRFLCSIQITSWEKTQQCGYIMFYISNFFLSHRLIKYCCDLSEQDVTRAEQTKATFLLLGGVSGLTFSLAVAASRTGVKP